MNILILIIVMTVLLTGSFFAGFCFAARMTKQILREQNSKPQQEAKAKRFR